MASSVDVTSGCGARRGAGRGRVQAVADALVAVVAEQAPALLLPRAPERGNGTVSLVNEAVADAVSELILATRDALLMLLQSPLLPPPAGKGPALAPRGPRRRLRRCDRGGRPRGRRHAQTARPGSEASDGVPARDR